jgi:hypothetical protein
MRDQGVIWLKLDCLNPSFFALIAKVNENWMKRFRVDLSSF